MAEALLVGPPGELIVTAPADLLCGELLQVSDGRAAAAAGLAGVLSGDLVAGQLEGQFRLPKPTTHAFLSGGRVYWDRANSKASYKQGAGDFFVGVCVKDAATTDDTVLVDFNVEPSYKIDTRRDLLTNTTVKTAGSPNTARLIGAGYGLTLDSTAEAQKVDLLPIAGVKPADGPILEGRLAIFDIGNNGALDINVGLASATHATDFDSVAVHLAIHLDGNALSIHAQSKDGTTTVAAADTLVDAVDDTWFELWIDCRDPADCKIYLDGVRVLTGSVFKLDAALATTVYPIAHVEKTSNATVADLRVEYLTVRTADVAA